MKKTNVVLTLACLTSCLCFANGSLYAHSKTPGEKLDHAIDAAEEKAEKAKDAVKEKYDDAKETVKEKWDDAREAVSEKITPAR